MIFPGCFVCYFYKNMEIKISQFYQKLLLNQFSDYKIGTIGASLLINQNVKLKT